MTCDIRPAQAGDAADISRVIIRALRETNAKDYTPDIIARVELSFSSAAVERLIDQRDVFVAEMDNRVVGTASLDGHALRTMFVLPDVQGRGIGRLLVQRIERVARERQLAILTVPATVTAEAFYARLGFTAVREAYHGEERTIVMERVLSPTN
ncbi:N-acetylglutamate synthase-like GNAT family acetyltransferase [Tardiphaga robiniae]|jgi:N-acetylglutamate synthase-like GNAT family acetyltransferase|uniref:GNAT family N-acetyltransferase n=1 Tax=Tardiphaga robiniae TaxID=943830 RepID=UPI002865336F|nr:GNAT family N-acetyltransferase [Tardiphaga robiniae]MDR6660305.1 N-acetylglutamate synthase-like GNAT family acetyltransferase [Tardiphaga robiniae]